MLKVKMLGTGSAFSKRFHNTSALVEFPTGYKLLLDCGHTTPAALHKQGMTIKAIDGIFISHLHADHVGGLEEVALYNMYINGGKKADLMVPLRLLQPLWNNCLKAGLAPGGFRLEDYFNVHVLYEFGPYIDHIDGIPIKIFKTEHVKDMPSYAIGFGNYFFYSADTLFNRELIDMAAENYHKIFHDCQLSPKGGVHASIEELLTLPEDIQKKIYLMHYGDNVDQFRGGSGLLFMRIAEEGDYYLIKELGE